MAMEPGLRGEAKLERGQGIMKMEAEQFGEQVGDAEYPWPSLCTVRAVWLASEGWGSSVYSSSHITRAACQRVCL